MQLLKQYFLSNGLTILNKVECSEHYIHVEMQIHIFDVIYRVSKKNDATFNRYIFL